MEFDQSPEIKALTERVRQFMQHEVYPAENCITSRSMPRPTAGPGSLCCARCTPRPKRRDCGYSRCRRRSADTGSRFSEYAPLAEAMSMSPIGAETFNCYTGTIWYAQLIHQHASPAARERYLPRLLGGEIRAAISITEPDVPGSRPHGTEVRGASRGKRVCSEWTQVLGDRKHAEGVRDHARARPHQS